MPNKAVVATNGRRNQRIQKRRRIHAKILQVVKRAADTIIAGGGLHHRRQRVVHYNIRIHLHHSRGEESSPHMVMKNLVEIVTTQLLLDYHCQDMVIDMTREKNIKLDLLLVVVQDPILHHPITREEDLIIVIIIIIIHHHWQRAVEKREREKRRAAKRRRSIIAVVIVWGVNEATATATTVVLIGINEIAIQVGVIHSIIMGKGGGERRMIMTKRRPMMDLVIIHPSLTQCHHPNEGTIALRNSNNNKTTMMGTCDVLIGMPNIDHHVLQVRMTMIGNNHHRRRRGPRRKRGNTPKRIITKKEEEEDEVLLTPHEMIQ